MPTEIIRERNAAAGAWAAAAVVLAIGALVFGFTAHLRANDLEAQLTQLRARSVTLPGQGASSGASPATGGDSAAGASGSTASSAPASTPGEAESAARIAVTKAFSTLYDSTRTLADRVGALDNPEGIADALGAAENGENGALVRQVVISVNDVKFSTPNAAQVTYTLTAPGGQYPGRSGSAVFIDGAWKVSRTTICRDLVDIGAGC